MRRRHQVVGLVVVVLAAFQVVPVERSNPPEHRDPDIPADARAVLERACYDCHSNRTQRPWYAHVAPVSWLISHDVTEARAKMNLSTWHEVPAGRRRHMAEESLEEAAEGHMPPKLYRLLHRDATLTDADLDALARWSGTNGVGGDHGDDDETGHSDH